MTLSKIAKLAEKFAVDNAPAIMTAIGVSGALATAYLTGKASFKAAEIIADKEHDFGNGLSFRYGRNDKIKLIWKLYVPAAATAGLTITAIIFANRIGTRRAAAVAAAYSLSEKAIAEYKEKVIEKIGEKKEQAVRDDIAQDRVRNNPPVDREIIITGNGEVLCCDLYSRRYFLSNIETLKRAENDLNHALLSDFSASLTDFYSLIGLRPTDVSDNLGWNSDKLLKLEISTTLSDDDRPCIAFRFNVEPIKKFYKVNG